MRSITRRSLLAGLTAGALIQACASSPRTPPNRPVPTETPASFGYANLDQPTILQTIEAGAAQASPTVPSYARVTPVPAPTGSPNRIQKGMSYIGWSVGDYSSSDSDLSLQRLASLGTEWVALIWTGYQDRIDSTTVNWGSLRGATEADLIHAIAAAHLLGLRVMLKPHVDLNDSTRWRGEIGTAFSREDQWRAWFDDYRVNLLRYARIAEFHRVEQFCVGTELQGLSGREQDWRDLIAGIRKAYTGRITYASNHDGEERSIRWWDAVDLIGVDAYYSLVNQPTPSVDDLKRSWQDDGYVKLLQGLSDRHRKPLLFTEVGYRSVADATWKPWDWESKNAVNQQTQANAYRAAIETFGDLDWFAGYYWWSWDPHPLVGGPLDDGYTPMGKDAEEVLRRYYGRDEGR